MPRDTDAFRHHPGLRGLITPPEESGLRRLEPEQLRATLREKGMDESFVLSTKEREADRKRTLESRPEGPLWVFGYGSLMWDPGFPFVEVRRAFAPLHQRRMILRDIWGARGDADRPGVMAALDDGAGCHGLAFCMDEDGLEIETLYLFNRERVGPAYKATYVPVHTDQGELSALTFVADHATEAIVGDMPREEIVRYMATGSGWIGTSLDYGQSMIRHFAEMGIEDAELAALVSDAEALAQQD